MIRQSVFLATSLLLLTACSSGSESVEEGNPAVMSTGTLNDPNDPNDPNGTTDPDLDSNPSPLIPGALPTGSYLQFNDSPYANIDFSSGYFYLEDFEDGVLEYPGASADQGDFTTISFGPLSHDSVDADDGLIDGNSLDGESWFYKSSRKGVTWTFDATQLNNQLPTHVGIVWTDGRGEITFEAFDIAGNSVSLQKGIHADNSFEGGTAEDRFYGVVHEAGIKSIHLKSDGNNGIEMDHLQWGYIPSE